MVALADDYDEVREVTEGNIAALTGLKVHNFTNDTDSFMVRTIISFIVF